MNRSALCIVFVFFLNLTSATAQETRDSSVLEANDAAIYVPLTCLVERNAGPLCDGAVGVWQYGRAALAVEALAAALKEAGVLFAIEEIEAAILADAMEYGFDYALFMPAFQLFMVTSVDLPNPAVSDPTWIPG